MDDYINIGLWFAVPAGLITFIASIVYAATEYGLFIGIPLGFFVGAFFAFFAAFIALWLWPIIAGLIIYAIILMQS